MRTSVAGAAILYPNSIVNVRTRVVNSLQLATAIVHASGFRSCERLSSTDFNGRTLVPRYRAALPLDCYASQTRGHSRDSPPYLFCCFRGTQTGRCSLDCVRVSRWEFMGG